MQMGGVGRMREARDKKRGKNGSQLRILHDYSENIICMREWNPNTLESRMAYLLAAEIKDSLPTCHRFACEDE